MWRRARLPLLGLFGVALALVVSRDVGAQSPAAAHTIRMATLAPRNPVMVRGVARWNQQLAAATDGRLQVRVYWGGQMGDERTVVRKMRIGDVDAASLTSSGLSLIYRPVLALQAPGIIANYRQVDAVREQIGPELQRGIEGEGFGLLGFGDSGRIRIFSREPVRRPQDLRRMRPWVPRTDAIFRHFLAVVGATGVPLSIGEVFGGLRSGMIDAAPGTALAVAGLQWFTSVQYCTAQGDGFLVGGLVVRRGFLDQLSEADRRALIDVSAQNHQRTIQSARQADERAYEALQRHGITPIDVEAHRAEWEDTARQTRQRMSGAVVPAELLRRVEAVAAAAR
ncbi:MAG: TRAP transporter substrate-binding protein DctP [Sandaracinaceae bacterium]|nr:TRAP transporter substrate-binding protein DctP [Sandaracinaceae bacterium]